ncbi:ABC transporter substrate-binding protein [Metasolibacillus meyeri]|uniref:ABC transporter substrate-binding protein n=1 Tax=Metasolibacillus meyeri TaxID=1071052 RepID=A0AAW9NQZ2_9BACL|nr:ABC transporter substrate-binding protein [Metasolibacillus meyeri]MEC1176875.1 ABC transporter substrate-binding protein [Metasolibacillus meyeri]
MKRTMTILSVLMLIFVLTACKEESNAQNNSSEEQTKTITYLNNDYIVPATPQKIIFLNAFESLEDAIVLGIKPYAASAIGDEDEPFPSFFGETTANTIPLLGTSSESLEYILKLAPDVIISTDMEEPKILEQLEKIAPVIPTSHYGPDWQANLEMLAEVTGKTKEAKALIDGYHQDKQEAINYLNSFQEKDVMAIRVRGGEMMVYPEDVFLNDVLYGELNLRIPETIQKVSQQTVISLEGLYKANPDYIFIQYDIYENDMDESILDSLQQSPVWQGLKAVQNNQVFINKVDPLVMGGGTLNGRVRILEATMQTIK